MEHPRPDPEALLAHEAFLRRIARPLVRDESGVDDVVQETWLTALRKPPRDGSRLRQWLGTVARNLALRARRADERRTRREQAVAKREGDDVVARVARHQKIVDAVLSLEEPYRTAVLLRFYDGLPTDDIGARSGISGAAVRKRLAKALELLRARLDELHGGDRRAWSAVLLPFVVAPRMKPAALVGGIVMGTKAKLGLAAVLLLALLGTIWTVTRPSDAPTRSESVAGRPSPATDGADAAAPPDPLPSPIDFSLVDRDRDVHGVVVSSDGSPVAGADVEAFYFPWRRLDSLNYRGWFEDRPGPRTRSAVDGTFAIRLEWGDIVHLRTGAAGFATRELSARQAGERIRIVLSPAVRLLVRVRDDAGRAVARASLRLVVVAGSLSAGWVHSPTSYLFQREGVTDGSGTFVFTNLPDDGANAQLDATHETLASRTIPVTLPKHGEADVTVELPAGITVRGRVVDAGTQAAILGAVVSIRSVWAAPAASSKATRTDPEGRYEIRGVSTNDDIEASADDYVSNMVGIYRTEPLCYSQYWPQRRVEGASEVSILLEPPRELTGRVVDHRGSPVARALVAVSHRTAAATGADGRFMLLGPWHLGGNLTVLAAGHGRASIFFDASKLDLGDIELPPPGAIEGRVLAPDDAPVARAVVSLQKGGMGETRLTDDLGRFRFPDLEPGIYTLVTIPEGAPQLLKVVELPRGGRVTADLQFTTWRAIVARVRGEDGAPVAGATVRIADGFRMAQSVTDVEGIVRINFGSRPRFATVEPPAPESDLRYRYEFRNLKGSEEEIVFALKREGLARGKVRSPEGDPVPFAEIQVRQGGERVGGGGTGEDGSFEIRVPCDAPFDLVLTGHSFDANESVFRDRRRLLRGELTGIRAGASGLVLDATAVEAVRSLLLRVVAPDGAPVEGAHALAQPSAYPRSVRTDADGRAELKGLPDEEVRVSVSNRIPEARAAGGDQPGESGSRDGYAPGPWLLPDPVRVVPRGQELTIRFREPVVVEGRVRLPDDRPARQATVEALQGDEVVATCGAGPGGTFRLLLEPTTKGPLRLLARCDSLESDGLHEGSLDSVSPGARDVEITVAPAK